jgi:hypothetical protein
MPKVNGYKHLLLVQSRITSKIGADDAIIGPQTYWFGLFEHTYYSWEQLVYSRKRFPDLRFQDVFCEFKPDILIRDDHLDQFITDEVTGDIYNYNGKLNISREEIEEYLAKQAIVLDDFYDSQFGHVRIYRLKLDGVCSAQ